MTDRPTTPRTTRTPRATYRLQLGTDLDFAAAAELVPYLADLGVSHVYLSPILQARPGSTHGYDVADPTKVSEDLGGEEGLRELAATAHEAGLGLVVDLVPNHLGTGWSTPLWRGLLAGGPTSGDGRAFDVDLDSPTPGLGARTVVPVLGGPYGEVLEAGELELVQEGDGGYAISYHEHRFPIRPESNDALERAGGPAELGGTPGEPRSWDRLHALLEEQPYRLVHWRAAQELVNYRRFFSIDELAAVRVELEQVFAHTHATVLRLVTEGVVDGLRIDHPDGLRDPRRYLERLAEGSGGAWTVVEKITAPGEALPDWPVAGQTGYDFCNAVLGLFVDASAGPRLSALEAECGADPRPYERQLRAGKREVLTGELHPDLRRVMRAAWAVLTEHRHLRDVGEREVAEALVELLLGLDVYRTYVDPETGESGPEDVARVEAAVARALHHDRARADLIRALGDLALGRLGTDAGHLEALARLQQLSGALMAKGAEDTVFYRYTRLLAVNEVGGEPAHLGSSVASFHEQNADRAARHPTGMTTTATHDTKRGEDARLRIAALSEHVDAYVATVRALAAAHDRALAAPVTPAVLPLVVQTLVAVWPVQPDGAPDDPSPLRERVAAYLEKALREDGGVTSWRDPDEAYEHAVIALLDELLATEASFDVLRELVAAVAPTAMVSGLAQVLVRTLSPGVPDTYQGTEGWDLSLVDPDNRRPVDFAARAATLAALADADPAGLLASWGDARVKHLVLAGALRARRDHAGCVGPEAAYEPIAGEGARAEHVVAFARSAPDGDALVAVAPRLPGTLGSGAVGEVWGATNLVLPEGGWTDLLTGGRHEGGTVRIAELCHTLPVALLARRQGGGAG